MTEPSPAAEPAGKPTDQPTVPVGPDNRPRPILAAIRSNSWVPVLGSLITAALTFGLLNSQQASVLTNVVAALATLVTAVTAAVHAMRVLRAAEPQVTPTIDPRADDGTPLVPAP